MPLDLEKLRSISSISKTPRVREGRDDAGARFKAVTDELGNVVTQRGDSRQDVQINAPHLKKIMTTVEERS